MTAEIKAYRLLRQKPCARCLKQIERGEMATVLVLTPTETQRYYYHERCADEMGI